MSHETEISTGKTQRLSMYRHLNGWSEENTITPPEFNLALDNFSYNLELSKNLYTNDKGTFFDEELLQRIQQKNNAKVLSILQDVDPTLLTDSSGTTLLHFAAKYGNEEFAQHLIDSSAKVDVRNRSAETPLMWAVDGNKEGTVKLLLELNADPFVPDINGQCALGKVLSNRENVDERIVKAILNKVTVESLKENGEYLKSQRFHTDCGIYHFMSLKNNEMTRFLLEAGSPVDAKNPRTQETALHVAVELLDLENVEVLLEHRADVNAERHDGEAPIACIPVKPNEDQSKALTIMKVLLAAGAKLIDHNSRVIAVESLFSNGNREIIRALLECSIDLQFMNNNGETALHILARNKHADVLEEVPDLRSAAKVCTGSGFTMLHVAAANANMNAIRSLLDHGADVDVKDSRGISPLFYTVCSFAPFDKNDNTLYDFLHSIELLLERGAHPLLRPSIYEVHNFEEIKDQYMLLATPVLAHLALLEASGQRIRERRQIESSPHYQIVFDSKLRQLEETKQVQIDTSVNLFDFLIASDRKISQYARNRKLILNLTEAMEKCSSDSFYHRMLRKRFLIFSRLVETRKKVANAINEAFGKSHNISVDVVATKIVNYLDDEELHRISPIFK